MTVCRDLREKKQKDNPDVRKGDVWESGLYRYWIVDVFEGSIHFIARNGEQLGAYNKVAPIRFEGSVLIARDVDLKDAWTVEKKETPKRAIEFIRQWDRPHISSTGLARDLPEEWGYVDCLTDWGDGQLMLAWDESYGRDSSVIYWGYWNDGVVE